MVDEIYKYLQSLPHFDGSVLVVIDGNVIVRDGFGYADRERLVPNSSETRHRVGSITKSFTAVSVLQLAEQGLISLDAPLNEYIEGFPKGHQIKLHHLLNQKSGLVDHLSLKNELLWEHDYAVDDIIKTIMNKPLRFEPGAKWEYSNFNYLVLGRIVELVAETHYHDYVKTHILLPAGMSRSGFVSDHCPDQSKGYRKSKSPLILQDVHTFACGDLVSTVEDLYKYHLALESEQLLSQGSIHTMQSPHHTGKYVQYGYGWVIHNRWGGKAVTHSGGLPTGYTSSFERCIDQNAVIIVLCNNQYSSSLLCPKEVHATWITRNIGQMVFNKRLPFYKKIM